jgi:sporulation protein YlmC with PRC-barrel domain
MRLMASEFKNASILLNESDIEALRRTSNPMFISLDNEGKYAEKVSIGNLAANIASYQNKVFFLETAAFSHYGKISKVETDDNIKYKLTVNYLYDENNSKVLQKLKAEGNEEEQFITGESKIQLVYPFEIDSAALDVNMFFDKEEGKSSESDEFKKNLQSKLESLKGKSISLNDKYLGKVEDIVFNTKLLSLKSVIKNVTLKLSMGDNNAGPDNHQEKQMTIKYKDIGKKGEVGKKYFQVVKILQYA